MLGFVERGVRGSHERAAVFHRGREQGDADARRDAPRHIIGLSGGDLDLVADALGDAHGATAVSSGAGNTFVTRPHLQVALRLGTVRRRVGQHHGELITAVARRQVDVLAQPCLQDFGDDAQDSVAGHVAKIVVEGLEAVDVDHQKCERQVVAARPDELIVQTFLKPAVVAQAGQSVVVGLFLQ